MTGQEPPDDLRAQVPDVPAEAATALATANGWVGGAVQGVGLGRGEDGGRVVVVYVTDADDPAVGSLPPTCDGLPVTVVTDSPFRAGG